MPDDALDAYVTALVAEWPPLTDDQCARIAVLLDNGPSAEAVQRAA